MLITKGQKLKFNLTPVLLGLLPGDQTLFLQGTENGVHLGFQDTGLAAQIAGGEGFSILLSPGKKTANQSLIKWKTGNQSLVVDHCSKPQLRKEQFFIEHRTSLLRIVHKVNYKPKPYVCQGKFYQKKKA